MKIAINMVMPSIHGGFHTYNYNILKGILNKDRQNYFYIFINQKSQYLYSIPKSKRIKVIYVSDFFSNTFQKHFWIQCILPFKIFFLKVDLMFSPINFIPVLIKLTSIKNIVVIHTNLPFLYPKYLSNNGYLRLLLLRFFLRISIILSDKVIANSKTAKSELEKIFPLYKKKFYAIYLSVEHDNFNGDKSLKNPFVSKKIDIISEKYFLSISSASPYHKLIELVKAYEILFKKNNKIPKLILVTKNVDNIYFIKLKNYIKSCSSHKKIVQYEYIDQNFLPSLYRNAELYIFSSCCEVFGLTNLEAMYCKVPVITSKKSAMPEICGDAAIYFDPENSFEIAEKIDEVLNNYNLRVKLIKNGERQIKNFSWDLTCEKTLDLILSK